MKKSNTELANILNKAIKDVKFETPKKENLQTWGGKKSAWLKKRIVIEKPTEFGFMKMYDEGRDSLFDTNNNSIYPITQINGYDIYLKVDEMTVFDDELDRMRIFFYAQENTQISDGIFSLKSVLETLRSDKDTEQIQKISDGIFTLESLLENTSKTTIPLLFSNSELLDSEDSELKNMVLKFGKYKELRFCDAPKSYQDWLLKQDWFNKPIKKQTPHRQSLPLHRQSLNGWDGYSKRGQAIEDAIFENDCIDQDLTNDELYLKYNS